MHNAQHRIAVLHGVDNHADGDQVIDLIKGLVLEHHLLVDRIEVLRTSVHVIMDMRFIQLGGEFFNHHADVVLTLLALHADLLNQHLIAGRVNVPKRQVFQFRLDRIHAQPVGQGRVDIERFPRDGHLSLRGLEAQRAHVVQAVRELNEHNTDIAAHGQDHLSEAFRLGFLTVGKIELIQFGDTVHQLSHFVAELAPDILELNAVTVFDRIVQKTGRDRGRVNHQLGENARNKTRMNKVRLTALAFLTRMRFFRKMICFLHQQISVAGIVLLDSRQHLIQRHFFKNRKHGAPPLFPSSAESLHDLPDIPENRAVIR